MNGDLQAEGREWNNHENKYPIDPSCFTRYFGEDRRESRGSPGRKRIGQSPGTEPGKRRSPNARSRSAEKRNSKPKERVGPRETALERKEREEKEAKEKKEKEEQEYQERLNKLSTPEREVRIWMSLNWWLNLLHRSWRLVRRSSRQGQV